MVKSRVTKKSKSRSKSNTKANKKQRGGMKVDTASEDLIKYLMEGKGMTPEQEQIKLYVKKNLTLIFTSEDEINMFTTFVSGSFFDKVGRLIIVLGNVNAVNAVINTYNKLQPNILKFNPDIQKRLNIYKTQIKTCYELAESFKFLFHQGKVRMDVARIILRLPNITLLETQYFVLYLKNNDTPITIGNVSWVRSIIQVHIQTTTELNNLRTRQMVWLNIIQTQHQQAQHLEQLRVFQKFLINTYSLTKSLPDLQQLYLNLMSDTTITEKNWFEFIAYVLLHHYHTMITNISKFNILDLHNFTINCYNEWVNRYNEGATFYCCNVLFELTNTGMDTPTSVDPEPPQNLDDLVEKLSTVYSDLLVNKHLQDKIIKMILDKLLLGHEIFKLICDALIKAKNPGAYLPFLLTENLPKNTYMGFYIAEFINKLKYFCSGDGYTEALYKKFYTHFEKAITGFSQEVSPYIKRYILEKVSSGGARKSKKQKRKSNNSKKRKSNNSKKNSRN